MALLGAINCLGGTGNTGVQQCSFDPKLISGAILAPKGTVISTATLAGFKTALSNALYAASKTGRIYPVYGLTSPKDSTEAKTVQTFASGQKKVVREGFNDWGFAFIDGGISLLQQLRKFNGSNWDFFFIDNDPTGQKFLGINNSAANTIKAIPSDGGFFWAGPWGMNDGSKITDYPMEFVFNTTYANDALAFVQADYGYDFATALPGLKDVLVGASATVNATAKHFNITLTSPLGVDIGALYATALASVSLWTGAAAATPTLAYTITSATWVPSVVAGVPGYFDILVGATNYATPPNPSLINLASPLVLAAAGITYESTGQLSIASV